MECGVKCVCGWGGGKYGRTYKLQLDIWVVNLLENINSYNVVDIVNDHQDMINVSTLPCCWCVKK